MFWILDYLGPKKCTGPQAEFAACGGIEVTALQNPINYNGLKMVKAGSKPLDSASELPAVRKLAEENVFATPSTKGSRIKISHQRLNRPM